MSQVQPPPIYENVSDDLGKFKVPWISFFNQVFIGDTGTSWSPSFTNLTEVGAPTITGRYYKISQSLCYFSVKIIPSTSTTATAGSTYINNFPLTANADGACFAVSGLLGGSAGQVDSSTNRIYPPGWTAVTVPLTIIGMVEIR